MRSKFSIYILFFSLWGIGMGCSDSQGSLDPSDVFIKYYGSNFDEEAVDLIALSDGYLVLGTHTNGLNASFYLVRTDLGGNTIWDRTYQQEELVNEIPRDVKSVPSAMLLYNGENNVIMVGTSTFTDRSDLYLIQVELSAGDLVFDESYRYDYTAAGEDRDCFGADVLALGDDFLVVGTADVPSQNQTDDDTSVLLMRWSNDLSTIKYERIKGASGDNRGTSLITQGGKYFYLSSGTDAVTKIDIQISEFDPISGNIDNPVLFSTPDDDIPTSIVATDLGAGDMTVTGFTGTGANQYAVVFRVSSSSLDETSIKTLSFVRNLSGDLWNTKGMDVTQRADGTIFILGQVNDFASTRNKKTTLKQNDIVLMPTGGTSSQPSTEAQPYGGEGDDRGAAVISLADGSMVIAATVDFDGDVTMISLLKTNSKGEFKP